MNHAKEIASCIVKSDNLFEKALEAGQEKEVLIADINAEYNNLTQSSSAVEATSHTRWTISNYLLAASVTAYLLHATGGDDVLKEKARRLYSKVQKRNES